MSVGLMPVTHNHIGAQLKLTASSIFNQNMPRLAVISIPADLHASAPCKYTDLVRISMKQHLLGALPALARTNYDLRQNHHNQ